GGRRAARNQIAAASAQTQCEALEHSQRALPGDGNEFETAAGATFPGQRRPDESLGRALFLRRSGVVERRHPLCGLRSRGYRAGTHGRRMDRIAPTGAGRADAAPLSAIAALRPRESSNPQSPNSMRIVFLTHEPFYPPSGGGSAEAVYLVREMVRRGHEVHLFCPQFAELDKTQKLFAGETASGPSEERNCGSAARLPSPGGGGMPGGLKCHLFTTWEMGRYTSLRNLKYLAFPFFLERMVERAARDVRFDLVLSQHAIS